MVRAHSVKIKFIDSEGKRKYLNQKEREKFYQSAMRFEEPIRSFGLNLFYTGTRISESLSILTSHFDFHMGSVLIRSLKKRNDYSERLIYLPSSYLDIVKEYIKSLNRIETLSNRALWPFTRQTGDRYIKRIMLDAGLEEVKTSAVTLRHSFAINALQKGVPITILKEFMGHYSIETTNIYTQFGSFEQKQFAMKMW